jgi:DNA methyltransferase 1-associated protein 1
MGDVKDILGVPRAPTGHGLPQFSLAEPVSKPQKERVKRPEGMSREAFALLGGSQAIVPTHLAGELKKDKLQVA